MKTIAGLDGARRQAVAAGLWAAWQDHGKAAALLTGFSGLGKSEQVVRPLVARATEAGKIAALVEVPLEPTDLETELQGRLVEELRTAGHDVLADAVAAQMSLASALLTLLQKDALVVIDEFQRVLDPTTGRPVEALGAKIRKLAQRSRDKGCVWLVSNREVDPTWTEPFYVAHLEAPTELADQVRIVLDAMAMPGHEERFPADRRLEVTRRLGANPRVLRLLGNLLRTYALAELLGPPGDVPDAPADPRLIDGIERSLLDKAKAALSSSARTLLRDLAILREPAPWALVDEMGAPHKDVRGIARELRERYLLEHRANRYHVHPVVREVEGPRLRDDATAWRDAHLRAGRWYARPLAGAGKAPVGDATLALHLGGARYHLVEAQATAELRAAMSGLDDYVQRKFSQARRPVDEAERDAQISLLESYLASPSAPAVEFNYAKLLKQRGAPGDVALALPHALRATDGQDFSVPWVLWIQLVREVEGLEAAVAAARGAVARVAPSKSLYSVYQLLGICLNHLGRAEEAIDALLAGAERADGGSQRLVEEASSIAATQPSSGLLQRVRDRGKTIGGMDHVVALVDVRLLEHRDAWRDAAEAAQRSRHSAPGYIQLALQEALCWLGAGQPQNAQAALDTIHWRYEPRDGNTWLTSLVALHCGNLGRASELLATYLDAAAPSTEEDIRATLLREWDHRVGTVGEPNPAVMAPILPSTVTGLGTGVRRPQHGPPVLPQHQSIRPTTTTDDRLRVLAVATEWNSGHGGLSTLNRQLCLALASAGCRVVCLVLNMASGTTSEVDGVILLGATRTPGDSEREALSRRPALPTGFTPDVIIGHGRVTGSAAVVLAEDHFPGAKLLHFVHMAPDEIEWFKPDRKDDAGQRAEERTQIELELGRKATRVVAIGPRLQDRFARDLSPYGVAAPQRLDPGFDAPATAPRTPPPGKPWAVLMLGRLEDGRLKGLDLAASAVGLAAKRRGAALPPLELIVRGAPAGTSHDVRKQLFEWAAFPGLEIVPRLYTSETDRLEADLMRASLVIMPSRAEGFGLVGLEAIVAATPVLVSSQSGLGELLREALEPEQAARLVVPVTNDDGQDIEAWANAIGFSLSDREAAFRRVAEVRELLGREKTWAAAIAPLLAVVRAP